MTEFRWWGKDCHNTPSEAANTIGAWVAGGKITMPAFRDANRIASAGAAGLSVDAVPRHHIQTLQAAGVDVVEARYRLFLDAPPKAISYITTLPDKADANRPRVIFT